MNITQLKQDVDFICGSTSAQYPDADKIRNFNIEYQQVATLIWESNSDWRFDDSNNTDTPIAYKSLAHASASYTVPTTALRIDGVEIKDQGGNWSKLEPITYAEIPGSPEAYNSSPGRPLQYWLNGNEIRLIPPPGTGSVTMASGMAVRLNRGVTEIATTATTLSPGFAAPYHRVLSYAASMDFTQDDTLRNFCLAQRERLRNGLIRFYSKRASELKTNIQPAGKKRWRNYL